MSRTLTHIALATVAAAALAVVPSAALATTGGGHHGDRNHDRLPDTWERAHHLSLKVNQASRDQDHDGLKNRAEFQAGTDPHKADSDRDGVVDGKEHAGKVASFDGTTLVVSLFGGGTASGVVDASTELRCTAATPASATARHDQGDNSGSPQNDGTSSNDEGDDNAQGAGGAQDQGDDQGDDNGRGHGRHSGAPCPGTALTVGAVVHEGELSVTATGTHWDEITLAG